MISDHMRKGQMKYEAWDQARPEHTTVTATIAAGFI